MNRSIQGVAAAIAWLVIAPAIASAQASITGTVRDSSGAVLPGVTVETASPALIEKVRSVASDGSGQYRIENLVPGSYSVTFTLPGFATVQREGIALTGTFTATVNAEMRVGGVEETVTVTGASPLVDVQSATKETVLDQEILNISPAGRNPVFMTAMLPAVSTERHDVGGTRGLGAAGASSGNVAVHGSSDTRMLVNGVSLHSTNGGYQVSISNLALFQEIAANTGGVGAEQMEGGVRMNLIPRNGGNTFSGTFIGSHVDDSFQGDNFSQELKTRGLATAEKIRIMWDVNPAIGGPIKQDRVWFFATIRYTGANSYGPIFHNKNAGNPNAWTYDPDVERGPARRDNVWKQAGGRITWQVTAKNKIGLMYDQATSCECPRTVFANISPEANLNQHAYLDPKHLWMGDWTNPLTNRLLLEAAFVQNTTMGKRAPYNIHFAHQPTPPRESMVQVLEQSNNLTYRATAQGNQRLMSQSFFWRIATSYITGAHAFKVGFNSYRGDQDQHVLPIDSPMSFRFNNGVPNRITLRSQPDKVLSNLDLDFGAFVQDRWTFKRMTLTLGLRFDYFHDSFPEQQLGPGQFVPTRNILIPAEDGVRWKDVEPRSGFAYDLFGDGTTALKFTLNRYMASQALDGEFGQNLSPAVRLVTSANRSWNDANRNFVPDCDLLAPAANGECGAMDNPDFGTLRPGTTYDPDVLRGWGKRPHNTELSAGVQRQVLPGVSVDVSYFRRWFGNLLVTDNLAVSPEEYDPFSITAPTHASLPGGGGYVISGLYDLKPSAFGRSARNFVTFAENYGDSFRHWNGVDVSVSARPRDGVLLSGGTSTGGMSSNNCEVVAKVDNPSPLYCDQAERFNTTVKFLGQYQIPRVDVQLVANFQSIPGPMIQANFTATNAVVSPSLGRNLSGGASNVTVNLVEPGSMYGERRNQLDLRIGKILQIAQFRVTPSLDLYNVTNANPVLGQSNAFGNWLQPQEILNARFIKLSVNVDF